VDGTVAPRLHVAPLVFHQREADVQVARDGRKLVPAPLGDVRHDALAARDGLRVNVRGRVREAAARDVVEDARLHNLNPREHQRHVLLVIAARLGHPAETRDEAVAAGLDHAEAFAPRVGQQDERGERVRPPVRAKRRRQVNVRDDLAVDDEEGVAVEQMPRVVERAARPEDGLLLDVVQPDAEAAAVAQRRADGVRPVVQIDDDLAAAVAAEVFGDVADQRFSEERDGGFRAVNGQRPQPRPVTGSKNHGSHLL
jgi:hypothetical protein